MLSLKYKKDDTTNQYQQNKDKEKLTKHENYSLFYNDILYFFSLPFLWIINFLKMKIKMQQHFSTYNK